MEMASGTERVQQTLVNLSEAARRNLRLSLILSRWFKDKADSDHIKVLDSLMCYKELQLYLNLSMVDQDGVHVGLM